MKKLLVSDISNTIYLANAKPVKGCPDLVEAVGEKQDYTDEAIAAVYQWFLNHCREEKSGMYQIRYGNKPWLTMDLSVADKAVPVVRGEWVKSDDYKGWLVCSACHDCYVDNAWVNGKKWRYCPNCGAKMEDKPCG